MFFFDFLLYYPVAQKAVSLAIGLGWILNGWASGPGQGEESMSSQDTQFGDPSGFLAWFGQGGKTVKFPLGPEGWEIQIGPEAKDIRIISPFYTVESMPPYGAWKICGVLFDFGGVKASGVIELGFKDKQSVVANRRRLVATDTLPEEKMVAGVFTAQPDCVEEPIVVVVLKDDIKRFKALTAEAWLTLIDAVRDGAEVEAVRALRRHIASSL